MALDNTDIFYRLANAKIQNKKNELKNNCQKCKDSNMLCPACEYQFTFHRNIYRANLPTAKVERVLANNLQEVCIREYDFLQQSVVAQDMKLYQDILIPYSKAVSTVLDEGYSLMFTGKNSAGKTVASVWTALAFTKAHKNVYYLTFPQLHLLNTASFNDEDSLELLQEIQNVDLLVVDEIGKETNKTGSVRYLADTYLKYREEYKLPTILISNLSIDAFKMDTAGYGPSFWTMLEERYRLFVFNPLAPDLRVQNRKTWKI